MLTVVLVAIALYLLYLALPNAGPALRAARLDGTPGVFTAQRLYCVQHPGHESCSWSGEFRSDDGATKRGEVWLYGSSRDSLRVGQQVRAYDIGRANRVYGPGGSREWIPVALMVAVSAVLLAYAFVRPAGRRGTAAPEPEPAPQTDPQTDPQPASRTD